jgi:hypothetical protein
MFPRYRHTPIFDSQRKRCPICNQSVYSLAGIHPQCAIKLDEGPQSRNNIEPAAEAEAPVVVETPLVTQVATKPADGTHLAGSGFRSRGVRVPAARSLPSKASHQGKK